MHGILVGRVGLEPTRYRYRQILSLLRLPIPPPPRRSDFTRFTLEDKENCENFLTKPCNCFCCVYSAANVSSSLQVIYIG